jgi:nucleolar MIF4G domain-containing protein 1
MKIPLNVQQLLEHEESNAQQDSSRFKNKNKPGNSLNRKSQRKAARNEVKTRKRARHSVPPTVTNTAPKPAAAKKKVAAVKIPEVVVKLKNKKEKSEQSKMASLLTSNPQFHKLLTSANRETSAIDQDEMNMKYYAKKLGIKQAGSIPQSLHDDGLGFLFKDITIPGMDTIAKEEEEDDDLEEMEELMEDYMGSDEEEMMKDDVEEEDSESEIEEMDIENGMDQEEDDEVLNTDIPVESEPKPSASKYVPPQLRKAVESASPASESRTRVKRALIGPLNRLNSTNLDSISVEIESVLLKNTRNGIIYILPIRIRCDG